MPKTIARTHTHTHIFALTLSSEQADFFINCCYFFVAANTLFLLLEICNSDFHFSCAHDARSSASAKEIARLRIAHAFSFSFQRSSKIANNVYKSDWYNSRFSYYLPFLLSLARATQKNINLSSGEKERETEREGASALASTLRLRQRRRRCRLLPVGQSVFVFLSGSVHLRYGKFDLNELNESNNK